MPWSVFFIVLIAAMALSAGLILALRPWLVRYALARPNARSSHHEPTPQGGGIAVVAATLGAAWLGVILAAFVLGDGMGPSVLSGGMQLAVLSVAAVLLAVIGAIDDIRVLSAGLRLLMQILAVGMVIAALPPEFNIVPVLPRALERALLLLGGVWFVNLVNFMDGLDWMTVAEVVPVTAAVALLGMVDLAPPRAALVAIALLGATLAFAPFNRPVARLFLGDVGSLPMGLLLGWVLMSLAGRGHLAAALLLPMYYLADTSITVARRILRGERFWEAHRTHFYQRATDGGFSVQEIAVRVFVLNLALAALALVSAIEPDKLVDLATLLLGGALVAWMLLTFARGKR
jgi:UDP-N-acetylmuramyl pentapeptide phosphotransferase/UDP-N-acetylglucosamine-1-phosphate transferase